MRQIVAPIIFIFLVICMTFVLYSILKPEVNTDFPVYRQGNKRVDVYSGGNLVSSYSLTELGESVVFNSDGSVTLTFKFGPQVRIHGDYIFTASR